MNLELIRNEDGALEARCEAPGWQQGSDLIQHLKKQFAAHVADKAEGPDSRTWVLKIKGQEILVYQWDTGDIGIISKDRQNDELLSTIAASVRREVV